MSVIATVVVDADDFTLGAALALGDGVRVRLERVVPVEDTFVPYLWVSDDDIEHIETALVNEGDIESFRIVDRADTEALTRVEWREDFDGFLEALMASDGTLLEGTGESETWRFRLRFADNDDLTAFYRTCAENGIHVDVRSVHNPGAPRRIDSDIDLTETQRETLRIALEEGYFDVPRRINLLELAERLGISDSAVSQRLRRGVSAVLAETLRDAEEREE